jgi:alcohol dehydrogenase
LAYKEDLPVPTPRAGTVVVKVSVRWVYSALANIESLPLPRPTKPYIPGGDAVGVIEAVGPDVFNMKKGQRVVVSRHAIVNENVPEPAQVLVGHTTFHPGSGGTCVLDAFPGTSQKIDSNI